MAHYEFFDEVSARFHENMLAAVTATDGIITVNEVRGIADRTCAAYVAELRKKGALSLISRYPALLDRRLSDHNGRQTVTDIIFEAIESDLSKALDVRIEWAAQFDTAFSPEGAVEAAADTSIRIFEETARKSFPNDVEGLDGIVAPARQALTVFGRDRSPEALESLEAAVSVVVQGLHAFGRAGAADRWYAAREAVTRLGRDADGQWLMAH
ncbi:hypothetical protein G6L37_06405 [Agrobacterium rubi]|nr:hypothetical protein [Agrobacterium rubi]NTF24994.1 hypothetical protein [Agrobacterium rubi]